MDPEELARKATASLLASHGLVADNLGQDNDLAASHRDQILSSLDEQGALEAVDGASLLTMHAWNPQVAALFFNNGQTVVTFKMAPGQPWQLAQVMPWEGTDADPYDMDTVPTPENVQLVEPKVFVYTGKDGEPTAAGRAGTYTS